MLESRTEYDWEITTILLYGEPLLYELNRHAMSTARRTVT